MSPQYMTRSIFACQCEENQSITTGKISSCANSSCYSITRMECNRIWHANGSSGATAPFERCPKDTSKRFNSALISAAYDVPFRWVDLAPLCRVIRNCFRLCCQRRNPHSYPYNQSRIVHCQSVHVRQLPWSKIILVTIFFNCHLLDAMTSIDYAWICGSIEATSAVVQSRPVCDASEPH